MNDRFRDQGVTRNSFALADILVVCPRCASQAVVTPWGANRRLACGSCGHAATRPFSRSVWGPPIDPYFELPLWLRADCRGHTLWAYNEAHLLYLEQYVSAKLRERGEIPGMTMVARLPAWLKDAKHRDDVLHALRQLKARIPARTASSNGTSRRNEA
ncbi:hypothetical protein Lesp02_49210 [Lentzea sp. NBRC 105346]|uniref:TFIIB-type zinc ribbon-containing protein n=1 Tax=Lentzea sp. NBRC 105346 TaxID=3032205 RepID=UPI0024A01978|nr:TFIIB-type zinc ribbon-containing protein [Lentzea sp. NBRC 105346]GLZ32733.1 hypothetical protein Lesp02_49210 [Lentzea sp. NBRC 105346]